jgi:hypothetical protein
MSPRRSLASQGKDLVGRQFDIAGAAHARNLPRDPFPVYEQPRTSIVELELDVAAWMDPKRSPHLERDRDLTLPRHPHVRKTSK